MQGGAGGPRAAVTPTRHFDADSVGWAVPRLGVCCDWVEPPLSLRAQLEAIQGNVVRPCSLDCFVAALLAMTTPSDRNSL
jgi:hypothetical protein